MQVNVVNSSEVIDLANYVDNGEWELMATLARRNVVYYPCCPTPYPDVTFLLHLRRRTKYYTYHLIIPCTM